MEALVEGDEGVSGYNQMRGRGPRGLGHALDGVGGWWGQQLARESTGLRARTSWEFANVDMENGDPSASKGNKGSSSSSRPSERSELASLYAASVIVMVPAASSAGSVPIADRWGAPSRDKVKGRFPSVSRWLRTGGRADGLEAARDMEMNEFTDVGSDLSENQMLLTSPETGSQTGRLGNR